MVREEVPYYYNKAYFKPAPEESLSRQCVMRYPDEEERMQKQRIEEEIAAPMSVVPPISGAEPAIMQRRAETKYVQQFEAPHAKPTRKPKLEKGGERRFTEKEVEYMADTAVIFMEAVEKIVILISKKEGIEPSEIREKILEDFRKHIKDTRR